MLANIEFYKKTRNAKCRYLLETTNMTLVSLINRWNIFEFGSFLHKSNVSIDKFGRHIGPRVNAASLLIDLIY